MAHADRFLSRAIAALWVLLCAVAGFSTPYVLDPEAGLWPIAAVMMGLPCGVAVGVVVSRQLRRHGVSVARQLLGIAGGVVVVVVALYVRG